MRTLDFYEFAGIVLPGATTLIGILLLYPELQTYIPTKDMTIGGFGVFLVLSYVGGHIVQVVGNGVEWAWWRLWGGMPTDWVWGRKRGLLTPAQADALEAQLPMKLGLPHPAETDKTTPRHWSALTRQVYAAVAASARAARVDAFNGNYGLSRGIVAALLLLAFLTVASDLNRWNIMLGILAGAAAATYRMHRFGSRYAQELFVQFLQLPVPQGVAQRETRYVDTEEAL